MVARSVERVRNETNPRINEQIDRRTRMSIEYFSNHKDQVDRRLRELDEEWDIERALETGSASISLFGLTLSILRGRKYLLVPLVVQGFFLQHAIQGWCPPLPILRRFGFRTRAEIEAERYALRSIRGDFENASGDPERSRRATKSAPTRA